MIDSLRSDDSAMVDGDVVLDQRSRALARPVAAPASAGGALHVIVRVGTHRIAVPVGRAQRCSIAQPVARLPGGGVGRLIGLVGTSNGVVPVADLADLLDVTATVPLSQRPMVIIDDAGEGLALLVDGLEVLATVDAVPTADPGVLTSAGDGDLRVLHVDALLDAVSAAADPPVPAPPGAPS